MSLSKCYSSLLDSMNAEIRIRWLQIVVRNDYYPDLHRVRRFLENQVQLHARDMTGRGEETASSQGPISPHQSGVQATQADQACPREGTGSQQTQKLE